MKTFITALLSLTALAMLASWAAGESTEASSASTPELLTTVPAAQDGALVAIRELTLKEGADPEAFEEFVADEYVPAMRRHLPGVRAMVVKGERGTDVGQYLYLWLFDSIHTRDLYFPEPDQPSELWQTVVEASDGAVEQMDNRLSEYVEAEGMEEYTDYVAIE